MGQLAPTHNFGCFRASLTRPIQILVDRLSNEHAFFGLEAVGGGGDGGTNGLSSMGSPYSRVPWGCIPNL